MGQYLTLIFTILSAGCSLFLIASFIHYTYNVYVTKNSLLIDSLVKKFAFISLFGYTTFVIISFILYLIQSLYYIPTLNIQYTILNCQAQTFNIAFFMMGKLAMYFYYMSLVYVAFRGSFLAYNPKIICSMAICFFFLMCTIGSFYMIFLYIDFSSVGAIDSPADCDKFEASKYSTITIWTGATCDTVWSFTCLLLFYLKLRKLTQIMSNQAGKERKETQEMITKITSKHNDTAKSSKDVSKCSCMHNYCDMIRPDGFTVSEHELEMEMENIDSDDRDFAEGVIEYNCDAAQVSTVTCCKHTYAPSVSSTSKIFGSLRLKLKRNNSRRKRRPTIVLKFLPIMLKLSILSAWSAFTTFGLGFGLWTLYPTFSSVVDSTINALCIWLSFAFTKKYYELLCSPFISCKNCESYRNVINEAEKMENDAISDTEQNVLR